LCFTAVSNGPSSPFWQILHAISGPDIWLGSSSGRGPRCAAWFLEHVRAVGDDDMQVMVLEGGIKGWVKSGPDFTRLMDGYKEDHWTKMFAEEEGKTDAVETRMGAGGDLKQ